MHRYRIIAQISLLSLVLAFPIVVHEVVVAKDVAAVPKNRRELESASRSMFPRSLTEATPSQAPQDSPGSTSSGYPTPHLSSASSESISGYSWLLDRPPRLTLSPDLQAQLHGSTSPIHLSNLGPPEPPRPPWPWWWEFLEPIVMYPGLLNAMYVPESPHASSSGSQEIPLGQGQGLTPPSSQHDSTAGSDHSTTETYSPASKKFTPPYHPSSSASSDGYSGSTLYSSASGGSLPSHYFSASGGSESESVPSHHSISISEEAPTEPPPLDNAEVFDENIKESMAKKLKIVAGVVIVGVTIASIVGSQMIKHRDYKDG